MPYIDLSIAFASFISGGYIGVKYKDTIQKWWYGASAFAKMLETKAAAVRAAVK